jgi:ABC-type branched-subunit amino acid transport system permease subunit
LFGGLGTLFGPLIGALTIYVAKHWVFTEIARAVNVQQADELMMYLLLIVLILKMPDGLFGWIKGVFGRKEENLSSS